MAEQSKELLLAQIESHLDALIRNASKMNQLAEQGLTEDEINRLQNEQGVRLEELAKCDIEYCDKLAKNDDHVQSEVTERIDLKLEQFEKLNDEFIEKLNKGHGIIQFDPNHSPKE